MREKPPPRDRTTRRSSWTLPIILALALIVRLWGLAFGLPYIHHADEPWNLHLPLVMLRSGDLDPGIFIYPTFYYYVSAAAYGATYAVGRVLHLWSSPADLKEPTVLAMGVGYTTMPRLLLVGRCVSLLASLLCIVAVYHLGCEAADDDRGGALAALLVALSPSHVKHAQVITPDSLTTLWATLAILGAVAIARRGTRWSYILAGVAAGLAASTKYNAAIVAGVIPLAHALRCGWRRLLKGRIYLAVVAAVVAFFVASPYLLIHWSTWLQGLRFNVGHYGGEHAGMEGEPLRWYLTFLWQREGPLTAMALLGALRAAGRREAATGVVGAFCLLYLAFVSLFTVRNDRTLLVALPSILALAASGTVYAYDLTRRRLGRAKAWTTAAGIALLCLSLYIPARGVFENGWKRTHDQPLVLAREWIKANLPGGSSIALEPYTVFVDPERYQVLGLGRADQSPDWYVEQGVEYVVFGGDMFHRFYADPVRYAEQVARYDTLFTTFTPIATFRDASYEIRIYRVRD